MHQSRVHCKQLRNIKEGISKQNIWDKTKYYLTTTKQTSKEKLKPGLEYLQKQVREYWKYRDVLTIRKCNERMVGDMGLIASEVL